MRMFVPLVFVAAALVWAGDEAKKVDPIRIPAILELDNAKCPVSGEDIDPEMHLDWSGIRVRFCCDQCMGKFEKAPDTYLAKLGLKTAKNKDGKAVLDLGNAKCPISGLASDPAAFSDQDGLRVHYCCPGCPKKFLADPVKGFAKLGYTYVPAVIDLRNGACPVSGEEIGAACGSDCGDECGDEEEGMEPVTADHEGLRVHFCCEKCVGAFEKDPAAIFKKLGVDPVKLKAETK